MSVIFLRLVVVLFNTHIWTAAFILAVIQAHVVVDAKISIFIESIEEDVWIAIQKG